MSNTIYETWVNQLYQDKKDISDKKEKPTQSLLFKVQHLWARIVNTYLVTKNILFQFAVFRKQSEIWKKKKIYHIILF